MPQGSSEGANSPLSPVSGAPTEVPTDCGRDDASREGDLAEEPTLVPELPATVPTRCWLVSSGFNRRRCKVSGRRGKAVVVVERRRHPPAVRAVRGYFLGGLRL